MSINGWWRQLTSSDSENSSRDPRAKDEASPDSSSSTPSVLSWSHSTRPFTARLGASFTVPFLLDRADRHIDGISLLENSEFVKELQVKLTHFNHSSFNFFPANWPVTLDLSNIKRLTTEPFVMAPKPAGIRYLLYVDHEGEIFMQNITQHIFKVARDCAPQMTTSDTILDGIVVRKRKSNNQEIKGNLTFVIMDATRVNGVDLTGKSIQERIAAVKEVLEPRLNGYIKRRKEVFDLDVAKYGDVPMVMEEYLSKEFEDRYDYPLHSFIFHSLKTGYVCGLKYSAKYFQWKQDDVQELIYPLGMLMDSVLCKMKHLGTCVDCRSSISGILHKCLQCGPNYNLCCQCVTNGTHQLHGHIVIQSSEPNVRKVDTIPPTLLNKLEALEVTSKEQGDELRRVVDRLERDENRHPSPLLEKKKTVEDIRHSDSQDFEKGAVPGSAFTSFYSSWDLVDDGESSNSSNFSSSLNGNLTSTEAETKVGGRDQKQKPPDDLIGAALEKMIAMGFQDEGGWLSRLLEVKGGDIIKVLNALKGSSS